MSTIDQFQKTLIQMYGNTTLLEMIDDPIVGNIKASKKQVSEHSGIMAPAHVYLIEYIEIKGIKRKETLYNSKECVLGIQIGQKRYGSFTLQLFHFNGKKQSYIYELGIPLVIQSQQYYRITINGVDGNIIIILHGKRARPLQ